MRAFRSLPLIAASVLIAGLVAGCQNESNQSVESATSQLEKTAGDMADKAGEMAETLGETASEALAQPIEFTVSGMTCDSCEKKIVDALTHVPGVKSAEADWESGKVSVQVESPDVDMTKIAEAIRKLDQFKVESPSL